MSHASIKTNKLSETTRLSAEMRAESVLSLAMVPFSGIAQDHRFSPRQEHNAITGEANKAVPLSKVKNGGETRPRFPAVYSSTREKKSLPNRLQSHTTTNCATTRSVERGPPTLVDPRRYGMNRPLLPVSRLGTDVCLVKRNHDGKK